MPIYNFEDHLGVDMTGAEQKMHFRHLENLWRRHSEEGTVADPYGVGRALERTPGYRRLLTFPNQIYSLFRCESDGTLFIHAGKRLYRLHESELPALAENDEEEERRRTSYAPAVLLKLEGQTKILPSIFITDLLPERPIAAAEVGKCIYFADGAHLYCYDGDGHFTAVGEKGKLMINDITITALTEPYVPLRSLDLGDYEQRNLLTDRYRQRHTFRESDSLLAGNAPIRFERTGANSEGVEECRAELCIEGDFGDTLVIPPATELDGVRCAVTALSTSLLSSQFPYTTMVLPYTMTSLPALGPADATNVHTVRIPRGVFEINLCFFKHFAPDLTIEYEGNESEWSKVQLKKEGYTGHYTVEFGYSEHLRTYGIPLCEASESVGKLYLDGAEVKNAHSERFHFFPLRADFLFNPNAPYTHIYILARTPVPLTGKTLSFTASALPFRYESEYGTHALGVTEGELKRLGIESGSKTAKAEDLPEGRALLLGCRLLTAYDRRLFFSGLAAVPDVIFYSHEDADGNPNPTYVAAMNYQTDADRMAVTGLYSASGKLCVTHASGARGKLTVHAYDLPDISHSLFLRLYPAEASYSLPRVLAGSVYEGRLHLLTEDGIFAYHRTSSEGYFASKRVSRAITPVIREIAALMDATPAPFLAALNGRIALFFGDRLYFGDSVLTDTRSGAEYEWYPQTGVGAYTGDASAYVSLEKIPASLTGAYLTENGKKIPLFCEKERKLYGESEVMCATATRLENGIEKDVTVYLARQSGALVDTLACRMGGVLSPPCAAVRSKGTLLFGCASGALLAYNTDLLPSGLADRYYQADAHRVQSVMQTFPTSGDARGAWKRVQTGKSYVFLRPMAGSMPTLTVQDDAQSRQYKLPAAPFDFATLDFACLGFGVGALAALPLPEHGDHKERSYTLHSDAPFAFLGISYTYDVKK